MPFDIAGARQSGYSDAEIRSYLSQQYDVDGALGVGYSLDEIAQQYQEKPRGLGDLPSPSSLLEAGPSFGDTTPQIEPAIASSTGVATPVAKPAPMPEPAPPPPPPSGGMFGPIGGGRAMREAAPRTFRGEAAEKKMVGLSPEKLRTIDRMQKGGQLKGTGKSGTAGWLASLSEKERNWVLSDVEHASRVVNEDMASQVEMQAAANPVLAAVAGLSESVPAAPLLRKAIAWTVDNTLGRIPGKVGGVAEESAEHIRATSRFIEEIRKKHPVITGGSNLLGDVAWLSGYYKLIQPAVATVAGTSKAAQTAVTTYSKVVPAIHTLKKVAPLTSQAERLITTALMFGLRSGVNDATAVAEGEKTIKHAALDAAQDAGLGAVLAGVGIHIDQNLWQIMAAPAASTMYNVGIDAIRDNLPKTGEESQAYIKQKAIDALFIATFAAAGQARRIMMERQAQKGVAAAAGSEIYDKIQRGFTFRDRVTGDTFRIVTPQQKPGTAAYKKARSHSLKALRGWMKGRLPNDIELTVSGQSPPATPPATPAPSATTSGFPATVSGQSPPATPPATPAPSATTSGFLATTSGFPATTQLSPEEQAASDKAARDALRDPGPGAGTVQQLQTSDGFKKATTAATKSLKQNASPSADVDAADAAAARVLKKFEGTTRPETTEEILNPTKAFFREEMSPAVRRNMEAAISMTYDNVLDMPTRAIYVNSIYRLASMGRSFSIGSADARNLGGLNAFFEGKVPDANGKYYNQEWAEAHPEFLDTDGKALTDHEGANVAYRMIIGDPMKAEIDGPEAQTNRIGGDEFAAVDAGEDAVGLLGKLERARDSGEKIAQSLGLHMLPHPKHDGLPTGFGLDVGTADHVSGTDPMGTSAKADGKANAVKGRFLEGVSSRYIDENGNLPYIKDTSREGAWKENPDYVRRDATQTSRLGQTDAGTTEGETGRGLGRPSETTPDVGGAPDGGASGTVKPPDKPPAPKPGAQPEKQKERSFPKTAEKKGRVGGESRLYTPQSNEESIKRADAIVKERGLDGAEQWVKSPESKGADKTAVAIRLIDHYQTKAGKETGARADASMVKALDIASETSKALTLAGQEIQAVRVLNKITPEMYLVSAQRRIDALNKTRGEKRKLILKTDDAKKITGLAKDAQAWDTLDKDTKATLKSIQKVMDTGEITSGDIETLKTLRARIADTIGAVPEPKAKGRQRKPSLNSMLQSRLHDMAAERMERFKKEATQIKLRAGLPAEEMADLSIIGAAKLTETGLKFVEWSKSMLGDFGDEIQPHLKKIYRKAQAELKTERARTRKLWEQATAIDRVLKRMEADEFVPEADLEAFKERLEEAEKLTGEARTEAILETQQAIEMLKPVGFWRKVSTIQTLAQLLNPKTIGRNIVGNALMQVAERVSRVVGTGIDIGVSKVTGKREVTFKTGGVKVFEEMYKGFMFATRRAWKGLPQGNITTKYQLQAPAFKADAEGIFKYAERTLAYMEKALGVALGATDRAPFEGVKNQMLGELAELAAINNKIPKTERVEYFQNFIKNASDEAIELSGEYGKYVTFQDDNFLSEAAVDIKRILNHKKEFGVGDLVLKYPKTPSNLVNRAFAYSPAGFVKSMYHLAKAIPAAGGEFNQRDFVMSLSRALVGTAGLTGMGIFLYLQGVITGDAENYNVSSFEREQTGGGPFRVNVSALTRWAGSGFSGKDSLKKKQGDMLVSYDWAQPLAISLSMGANAAQLNQENAILNGDYGSLLGSMVDLFSAGAQSFAELPMLTGIQTLFGRGTPANEGRRVISSLERVFEQAPSSFVPTFVYQIRQVMDNTARETHDPNPLRKALNSAINKIPFVEKMLPEAYNTMGLDKKEIYKGGTNSLFNVFFNPAFVTKYDVDPMVETLLGPYKSERRTRQLPKRAPRKLYYSKKMIEASGLDKEQLKKLGANTVKDRVVFELDAKEISTLQRFMAALTTRALQNHLTPEKLAQLKEQTPEQQEKVLAKVVGIASSLARVQFLQKASGKIKNYTMPKTLEAE